VNVPALHAAPQRLEESVIDPQSLAIHAELNVRRLQWLCLINARKLSGINRS
jgi:hypothetical protein